MITPSVSKSLTGSDEAHERIVEALQGDENFEIPCVDYADPFTFSPKVVQSVAVWEAG